ncbi:MAG: phosphoglucosamine mutase, partial [Pseudomonadota bacterium]
SWDKPVSEVCQRFEPVPQILKNVRYNVGEPLKDKAVTQAIAAGQAELANTGRLVIRKSGTEPLIRVMAEGDDEQLIERIVDDICSNLKKVAA